MGQMLFLLSGSTPPERSGENTLAYTHRIAQHRFGSPDHFSMEKTIRKVHLVQVWPRSTQHRVHLAQFLPRSTQGATCPNFGPAPPNIRATWSNFALFSHWRKLFVIELVIKFNEMIQTSPQIDYTIRSTLALCVYTHRSTLVK